MQIIKQTLSNYSIQVFMRGNCLLTGISGEVFCKMGLSIKEMSEPFVGIPVGYAKGYLGYFSPEEAWEKGGYEVQLGMWSKVGVDSYKIIMDTICDIYKKIF